ncbi:MAG: PAS domain-containing sensor histidine kinase [Leptospiraceae bacterium]|nr:PAS domain-containing sensor histidine kinase [Leptospiraceae bacterium]MCP5498126.1 PAS domain-containing sensor histidine kinase [Leptospiraceae bacterium]
MTQRVLKRSKIEDLQEKAEKFSGKKSLETDFEVWKDYISKLLEELSIHHVELEMQNDELHLAQEKLAVEKQKYQDLYDFAPIAYITLDEVGIITQLNYAAARLLGKPREFLQSNSIFPFLAEDSKSKFRLIAKNAFENGEMQGGELIFLSHNNERIYTKVQLMVYLEKNIFQEFCWITITDITLQKQAEQALRISEEKFRSYVESANDIVYSLDTDGIFSYLSPNITDSLGYSPEELMGNSFVPIIHPEDVEKCINFVKLVVESKKKQSGIEYRVRHKNGNWRWHTSNASPLLDKDGNCIAYLGISRDITEQKNTEQELRELNATKDKFFSIISHDLKGPISSIVGMLEIFKDTFPDEKKQPITFTYQSAKQTLLLLENLLLWSRSQTNRAKFNPEMTDIKWMLNDIILFEKYVAADKKQITIQTDFHMETIFVYADVEMVKIVIRNLLSNAVKFTHTGGEITIGCKPMENDKLLFYISDTGVGISPENQENLFKIDKSISSRGTKDEKGTGLGLILCKEFVEKNKGTIFLESEKNRGTIFYFTLCTKPF